MSHYTDTFPGREVSIDGKSFLYFGGTSYLGLQTNTDFQDLFVQNIRKYGTSYGASRKSNIKLSIFEKAESTLANLVGSQACTTLSSGYLAGKLVAQHFENDAFKCFYAPNTHSALFQKNTVPFKNFKDLAKAIKDLNPSSEDKIPVVFLDSIDTEEASYPNFEGLYQLPLNDVILVVDDSHGIGIMGENGGGAFQCIKKLSPKELVVCCSLGKGFGIQAGAIFGSKSRIDQFKSTDFFGGASPAAPAALATFCEGNSIYEECRVILKANFELFLSEIEDIDHFQYIPNHPVFTFENIELAGYLEAHGILTTNFKYPNEQGVLMSRIVIAAAHTSRDIELLAEILNTYS